MVEDPLTSTSTDPDVSIIAPPPKRQCLQSEPGSSDVDGLSDILTEGSTRAGIAWEGRARTREAERRGWERAPGPAAPALRPASRPGVKYSVGPSATALAAHRATRRPSGGRGHFQERGPQPPPAGPTKRPPPGKRPPGPPSCPPRTCPRAAPHRPAAPTARSHADPPREGRAGLPSHSPEPRRGAARLTAASEPGGRRGQRSGDSRSARGRPPPPLPSPPPPPSPLQRPQPQPPDAETPPHLLEAPPHRPASRGPAQ
ncbi:proline-rich protein HaeIII subfamily 1-like [Equus przewalskii]|uniref:Proline-rich protein HaeIII subfamily 1-like n=1 Tax=Equus przewalskii TaxID=9798 RepID=A0ABM4MKW9_EQUPR